VDGRAATVVYYRRGERQVGYVIVSGSAMPEPSATSGQTRRGVEYHALRVGGKPVVTWRRDGHTCVLTGETSRAELLDLAAWRAGGTRPY
jgi:hypothetical protein